MRASWRSYTFLNLFPEGVSAAATELMRRGVNPDSRLPVYVVDPPVAGLRLLSARGEEGRRLDSWWESEIPADSLPVIVTLHETDLEQYLSGLDADFVIGGVTESDWPRYAVYENVRTTMVAGPLGVTEYAMQSYATAACRCFRMDFPYRAWWLEDIPPPMPAEPPSPPSWPESEQAQPRSSDQVAPPPQPGPRTRFEPRGMAEGPPRAGPPPLPPAPRPLAADAGVVGDEPPSPLDDSPRAHALPEDRTSSSQNIQAAPLTRAQLLRQASPRRSLRAPAVLKRGLSPLLSLGRGPSVHVPREIGDLVLGFSPSPVVAVVSRAGGVGKTAVAAALAQVVGHALGDATGSAAIVDQNIGNPDQWGRLDIPPRTATVRSLMASLSTGAELPRAPAWASTPALAVYPEDRESAEPYSPGLVQRFVRYMRERHAFTVVDLPNRLPDASSAEGAICAFYLEEADLAVMPTTDDPNRLLGVLEYLDAPTLRGKPVIVSYIVSPDRKLRTHPRVVELLDRIRARAAAVVMVPKSEKATLAIVEGVSILEVSGQLRDAYVGLTLAAVRTLAAR